MNEPGHIDEDEAEAMSLRAGSIRSLMAVAIGSAALLLAGTLDPNPEPILRFARIALAVASAVTAVASAALFWLSSVVLKEAAAAREKASAASGEPE